MGLTSIHIHICYFILTQLILNYKIFWHNYRYGEGNTISFGYDKAEMPHALVWDGGEGGGGSVKTRRVTVPNQSTDMSSLIFCA